MHLVFNIEKLAIRFNKLLDLLKSFEYNPEIAIIAGSGISQSLIGLKTYKAFKYSELPDLATSEVEGHNKELIFGEFEGKKVLIFNGRFHLYEGLELSIVISPVIISYILGIRNLVITNAVGGLNPLFQKGDIMLIESIINLMFRNIIYTKRINDTEMFSGKFNKKISENLDLLNQNYKTGIYAGVTGPSYETSGEIRMLRKLGADVVGMSVIHEAISARILNMNVSACSLVTNSLKETNTLEISHSEVLDIAEKSKLNVYNYFKAAMNSI